MNKDEFYHLRPKEFYKLHQRYFYKESKQWEKYRWLATAIINFNGMVGQHIKETDLLKLPFDSIQEHQDKVDLSNNTRERLLELDEKWN
ncbi:hypothetical protein [Marinifilum breve]|nr:hypothetical protein [Marinifilum breve]